MMKIIFSLLIAYLIGSIPTSYIFGRIFKGIDIRKYGSGNVGATNVFRVMGKKFGIAVLMIDMLKGLVAVTLIAQMFFTQDIAMTESLFKIILGAASICGHIWTVFLGFKGGKGVATSAGVLIGLSPVVVLAAALVWVAAAFLTKYVSVASILAAISVPALMFFFKQPKEYLIVTCVLAAVIIIKHKSNIKRLIAGQEHRIGQKVSIQK